MRPYKHEEDLMQVNGWLIARGLKPYDEFTLPKYGMIVDDVAVGFMCATDSGTGFIEGFITNPNASNIERAKALDKISKWALEMLTLCGFGQAIVITQEDSFYKRALDLGFTETNYKVFSKNL